MHKDKNCSLQLNPRGLAYTVTLMIKFHDIFVTKADKAYQVRCFYRETDSLVTQDLNVRSVALLSIFVRIFILE